jgi:hypothetical protein
MVIAVATWILVFPQTKSFFYPIPSTFAIGDPQPSPPAEALPADPKPVSGTTTPEKLAEPPIKAPPRPPDTTPSDPDTEAPEAAHPEPEPRDSGALHRTLREIDKRFGPAHLLLFTGLTLLILTITGRGSQWRLPLALALLSEIIPEMTDHHGGWDDWVDLASNLAGVGLAVLLWFRLPVMKRFHSASAE